MYGVQEASQGQSQCQLTIMFPDSFTADMVMKANKHNKLELDLGSLKVTHI